MAFTSKKILILAPTPFFSIFRFFAKIRQKALVGFRKKAKKGLKNLDKIRWYRSFLGGNLPQKYRFLGLKPHKTDFWRFLGKK